MTLFNYISNPITGESLALPTPPAMALNMTNFTCGFGLSPMSGTYTIVWLRGRYGLEPEALGFERLPLGNCTLNGEDEFWVMNEYGVKESWSLEFNIVDIVYSSYVLKFGDGQLVLLHGDKLVAYARGSKGFVDVEFDGMQYLRDACVHIPSFASPKNILSGGRPRAPDREY
ncbi:unnamed protein product [Prunus armeniaca]|uniref:F-box associated domain-containing protein n=1 Tax=Prunus armeniaca TaxID=36596 RepID=A0A6J5W1V1_PRUAR|nr:unnamed protein product [Prunus armeniaca]